MNESFSKNKTILIAVVVLLLSFGAYYFFHKNSAPTDSSLITTTKVGDGSDTGVRLISLIANLNSIQLDQKIFADKVFKSFIDFSQPIPEQPKGGRNPFSPPSFTVENTTQGGTAQ